MLTSRQYNQLLLEWFQTDFHYNAVISETAVAYADSTYTPERLYDFFCTQYQTEHPDASDSEGPATKRDELLNYFAQQQQQQSVLHQSHALSSTLATENKSDDDDSPKSNALPLRTNFNPINRKTFKETDDTCFFVIPSSRLNLEPPYHCYQINRKQHADFLLSCAKWFGKEIMRDTSFTLKETAEETVNYLCKMYKRSHPEASDNEGPQSERDFLLRYFQGYEEVLVYNLDTVFICAHLLESVNNAEELKTPLGRDLAILRIGLLKITRELDNKNKQLQKNLRRLSGVSVTDPSSKKTSLDTHVLMLLVQALSVRQISPDERTQLSDHVLAMMGHIKEQEERIQELKAISKQSETLKTKTKTLQTSRNKAREEIEHLQAQLTRMEEQKKALEEDLNRKHEAAEKLKKKFQGSQARIEELEAKGKQRKIDELTGEKHSLELQVERLTKEIDDLKEKVESLRTQVDGFETRNRELTIELNIEQGKVKKTAKELRSARKQTKRTSDTTSQDKLQSKLDTALAQKSILREELRNLKLQVSEAKQEQRKLQGIITRQSQSSEPSLTEAQLQEKDQYIRTLERQLQDAEAKNLRLQEQLQESRDTVAAATDCLEETRARTASLRSSRNQPAHSSWAARAAAGAAAQQRQPAAASSPQQHHHPHHNRRGDRHSQDGSHHHERNQPRSRGNPHHHHHHGANAQAMWGSRRGAGRSPPQQPAASAHTRQPYSPQGRR